MREIKFRVWDLAGKKWDASTQNFLRISDGAYFYGNAEMTRYPVVLMQFTGLRDKNGKEIYEGDIVRVVYDGNLESAGGDDEVRQVIWGAAEDDYYPAFDLKGNEMEINGLSCAKNNGDIEVIGNIYENPELLK